MAFIDEFPDSLITVVADATFGHRIDKSELAEFDAAVANNEIVCPPAGAVGRGDAFVLSIANKVGATILSNDSYQEFHGTYTWLFEEGRLVGGKPVPHVGWVFVTRTPVRGVTSRKAVADAKRKSGRVHGAPVRAGRPSAEASQPMPTPKTPPPGKAPATRSRKAAAAALPAAAGPPTAPEPSHTQSAVTAHVNELMTFLTFVGQNPVGTAVTAVVDHYSSHGAYVTIGDVIGYVPLRLMADPPPRSAREAMKVGDEVHLVVESFAPGRRSIDLAVAARSAAASAPASAPAAPKRSRRTRDQQPSSPEPPPLTTSSQDPPVKPRRARKAPVTPTEPVPSVEVETAPKPKKPARARSTATPPAPAGPPSAPSATPAERRRKAAPAKAAPATPAPAPETPPARSKRPAKKAAAPAAVPPAPEPTAPKPAKRAPRSRAGAPAPEAPPATKRPRATKAGS